AGGRCRSLSLRRLRQRHHVRFGWIRLELPRDRRARITSRARPLLRREGSGGGKWKRSLLARPDEPLTGGARLLARAPPWARGPAASVSCAHGRDAGSAART